MKNRTSANRWVILIILSIGGGLIYQLPYLRYAFYEPLRLSMGVTDGQLGTIASIYGSVAMCSCLPGGYIADKFSSKKLISFSLFSTGTLGIWYSTFPSYRENIIIFSLWGIVTVLTYWSAYIKSVGMLSENKDSSVYYGISDGIRGLTATVVSFLSLYIFKRLGESILGIQCVILIFSFALILVSILSYIYIPDTKYSKLKQNNVRIEDLIMVFKMKKSWMIAGIILTTFGVIDAATFITPYTQNVFKAGSSVAVALGIIRTHITQSLGSPTGGIISKKLKSTPKTLIIGYIISLICAISFIVIPVKKSLLVVVVVFAVLQSFMLSSMRGIYFSTIDDANFAQKIRGSVIGFTSFIGFLPDAFFFFMAGKWMDNYGQGGYKIVFIYMTILCIIGISITISFIKELQKKKNTTIISKYYLNSR